MTRTCFFFSGQQNSTEYCPLSFSPSFDRHIVCRFFTSTSHIRSLITMTITRRAVCIKSAVNFCKTKNNSKKISLFHLSECFYKCHSIIWVAFVKCYVIIIKCYYFYTDYEQVKYEQIIQHQKQTAVHIESYVSVE